MQSKIKCNYIMFWGMLLLLAILFMSAGFATINAITIEIDGTISAAQPDGIYIYDVTNGSSSGASAEIVNYFNTTMHSVVTLSGSDGSSYVTKYVRIKNNTSKTYYFEDVLYDSIYYSNQDITFEISNFNIGDKIAPGETKDIYITFKYNNSVVASNNKLDSYLNFSMSDILPMVVSSTNGSAVYNGKSITGNAKVEVTDPINNYTILYGESKENCTLNTMPGFINVGTYTVYYKVEAENYETYNGELTITITKADAVLTVPTAKTLTYNGSDQELINAGSTSCGTIQYKLSGGTYSTSIPTATNAGTYTIYYKIIGNTNYSDSEEKSINVTIAKIASTYTTEPTNKSLKYSASAQELINAGSTSCGTIQYKLEGGTYSTTIPTATNAGTYTIYYKIVGDLNHNDSVEKSLSTIIKELTVYTITYTTGYLPYTPSSGKTSFTEITDTITLDTPSSTGFTFEGWYNNSSCTGTAITQITKGTTGNISLWAKWKFVGFMRVNSITSGSNYVLSPSISGTTTPVLRDSDIWPGGDETVNNFDNVPVVTVNGQSYIVTSDPLNIWKITSYESDNYTIADSQGYTIYENSNHCLCNDSDNINEKDLWEYDTSRGFRNKYYEAIFNSNNDYYLGYDGSYFDTWKRSKVLNWVWPYIQTEIHQSY